MTPHGGAPGAPHLLAIPDGELLLIAAMPLPQPGPAVLAQLIRETPWRHDTIAMFGKRVLQPRLTAWIGDADATYRYSGTTFTPTPWTPLLADLRARVEQAAGCTFNSVLLNYYRDGRDSMGMHSDDEPELGRNPVITSLSLGAPRVFTLKHKLDARVSPVKLELGDGSLLIMAGATQHYWKHGIAKTARPVGPRINLTFRTIRSAG